MLQAYRSSKMVWAGVLALGLLWSSASSAQAPVPALSSDISPIAFVVGRWTGDSGRVGGDHEVRGGFIIEPAVGGGALLRRDQSEILDSAGKVTQSFEQIMLIYPEAGRLRADYFDGSHAIHYVDVDVSPGRRVTFRSANVPSSPVFQLTYEAKKDGRLGILFEMKPPGQAEFHTIAGGTAKRSSISN